MVSHINIAADDEVVERAREVKEDRGWSWAEFIEEATARFEQEGETDG